MHSISSSSNSNSSPINQNQNVAGISNPPDSLTASIPVSADNKISSFALTMIKTTADASYSSSGSKISKGLNKSRVVLDELNPGFSIATKKIPKGSIRENFAKANLLYVHLKDDDQNNSIYLNVNSLSKRLHIDKKLIYHAAKNNQLEGLINTQLKSTKEKLILFETFMGNIPSNSHSNHRAPEIMKISSKILLESKNQEDKLYTIDDIDILVKKKSNEPDFISSHRIYKFDPNLEQVATGGTSTIHKIQELVISSDHKLGNIGPQERITWIFKKANEGMEKETTDEYRILNTIHAELKKIQIKRIGIQEPLRDEINVSSQLAGNIGTEYDGDLKKKITLTGSESVDDVLSDVYQLLYGISHLHDYNFTHHDLKPGNIFIKDKKTMISDVGGSQIINLSYIKQLPMDNYDRNFYSLADKLRKLPIHTPAYTRSQDIAAFNRISNEIKSIRKEIDLFKKNHNNTPLTPSLMLELKELNKNLYSEVENMVNLRKKWDSFSMGLILYERCIKPKKGERRLPPGLVSKKIHNSNYVGFSKFDRDAVIHKLIKSSPRFPREIANLITDLIDPTAQTTTHRSYTDLKRYLEDNYPKVITDVEALYPD